MGIETEDGFRSRTPFTWSADFHADYAFPLASGRLLLVVDVFNIFDNQGVVDYDQDTEKTFSIANSDYGQRTLYQNPRQVRLGVRFEF